MVDATGAHGAIDSASSGAHKAVDKMTTAASHAAENLGTTGEHLKNVETRALDKARVYVREHPLAALGIAAATGFLLSRLLRSR